MAPGSFFDADGMNGDAFRRMARLLAIAYFAGFAVLLLTLGGVAYFGQASDGDPIARFDVPPRPERHPVPLKHLAAAPSNPAVAPTSATVPPPAAQPAIAQPVSAGRNLVADPALIEQTADGPLPRIAGDGRTPMTAYAPPVAATKAPRIAIVIGGLGLSAKATAAAIHNLPPAVTLAFLPYESDVQHWVEEARGQGHEVLLEVPMEPYDFPNSDPGPHTLRAAAGETANTERLTWALTRFTGYAGIINLQGERFLADPDSLEPVMTFAARRGLLFFERGPQNNSAAPDIARRIAAPYVQSAMTLDAIQTGTEIDARLSALEQLARTNGAAAGAGFVYPVTLDRVADWAKGLQGRGFVLVPASAIVGASGAK